MKYFMNFFRLPFRSFFTLTALCAILVPMYFVGIIVNGYFLSEDLISVNYWHANEMIFGFTTALLSGFILTAAPKWASKPPVSAKWTIFLTVLWLLTRALFIYQPSISSLYISSSSILLLLMFKVFDILKGNKNAIVILTLLSTLLAAQISFIYAATNELDLVLENTYKLASFVISSFLIIFSGKLIPFFANSKLKTKLKQDMKFDLGIVLSSLIMLLSSVSSINLIASTASMLCFILLSIRIKRLYIKEVLSVPMLWILYIGHIWLNIYFLLESITPFIEVLGEGRAIFHTLYAGALGTISIGMITRVSLGHSGLEMKATKLIKISFYSIILGSILRVFHPMFLDGVDGTFLHISMGFWTLSYIFFLIYFFPKFISSKA